MKERTTQRTSRITKAVQQRQPQLTVVLENVKDPHNIMAVLRTADAAGVLNLHVVETRVNAFTTEVGKRSSTSARKWVPVQKHVMLEPCYQQLRAEGKKIYATHLDHKAESLYDLDLTEPVALVFGNEREGLSQEAVEGADANFHIPMFGMIKSLNISVACAITLYEAVRQRQAKGLYDETQLPPAEYQSLLKKWLEM